MYLTDISIHRMLWKKHILFVVLSPGFLGIGQAQAAHHQTHAGCHTFVYAKIRKHHQQQQQQRRWYRRDRTASARYVHVGTLKVAHTHFLVYNVLVSNNISTNRPAALTMMPITGDNNPAGLSHSPYPPGFGAAMAAIAANQQFASLMTSQGLPFMPHAAIQAMYSSPTSKYFVAS